MSNKTLPAAKFLHESGLLFKINRDVLHPRGLALVVVKEDDDSFRLSEDLLDCREDGIYFDDDSVTRGEEKLRCFNEGEKASSTL